MTRGTKDATIRPASAAGASRLAGIMMTNGVTDGAKDRMKDAEGADRLVADRASGGAG